jgi:hypothetical protein
MKKKRAPSPLVYINNVQLPEKDYVKCLRLYLEHIFAKQKDLGITLTKMYWLLGHKSKLSTSNKLIICNTILKPIWTYRVQLWGTTSTWKHRNSRTFPIESLVHVINASWYVSNMVIWRDLQIPAVKEEIRCYSSQYSAHLSAQPNDLTVNLMELPDNRRLWRHLPHDLSTTFIL